MSMTAQDILINLQKEFEFIKKDLDLLLEQIQQLVKDCADLDNSSFYNEDINLLRKKVEDLVKDINNNAYEKQISKDTHVAIETYHEIQRYSEKKREELANLKNDMYMFKQEVLLQEQKEIRKKLSENNAEGYQNIVEEVIKLQKTNDDKVFIRQFLDKNSTKFVNSTFEEIFNASSDALVQDISSPKGMATKIINDQIRKYGQMDKEMVEEFKGAAKVFLETVDKNNFMLKSQEFLKTSSSLAEQIMVRKDNIKKIIKSIQNVGYEVTESNVRIIKEKNIVAVHGEKPTGEYADFVIQMDGKLLINSEGFAKEDHDDELASILNEFKKQGLHHTDAFKKVYREPEYIAKKGEKAKLIKKTKSNQ